MKNKAIIYVGGFILPDKNAAANRVVSNGKVFNSLGYKTIFLGSSSSDEAFDGIKPLENIENMFEQSQPKNSIQWLARMFSVKNIEALLNKIGNVDSIILYNVPFFTLFKAKSAFKRKNIKICYDCTEWSQYTEGSFLKRTFKVIDEFLIRNFAHNVADKMIVISSMMAKKHKKTKTVIIPPLVDIKDEIWHQKVCKDNNYFEFCFAGVPGGNKESLDKVVDAFCSVNSSSAILRIVGITEDEFTKFYPCCNIPVEIKNRIIFMGMLSHREAIKYVLNCDCYIFIRSSDRRNNAGFPTKFSESFTCNVPIITSNISDIEFYMKDSTAGFLINDISIENIRNAMQFQINKGISSINQNLNYTFHYENYKNKFKEWLET